MKLREKHLGGFETLRAGNVNISWFYQETAQCTDELQKLVQILPIKYHKHMEHETSVLFVLHNECCMNVSESRYSYEKDYMRRESGSPGRDWITLSTLEKASTWNICFSSADEEAITLGEGFVWAHLPRPQDLSHYSMWCVMKEWPRALPNNLLIPQGIVQGGCLHNEPELHAANPLGSLCPQREAGTETDSRLMGDLKWPNISWSWMSWIFRVTLFKPSSCQSFPWFGHICIASHNTEST